MDTENSREMRLSPRESYIEQLRRIKPLDEQEEKDIAETVEWLKLGGHIHKPDNMEQHLGVLTQVLSPDRESVYLINHKKAQMWLPPGGHVDKDVSLQEAVRNEIREELNIEAAFIDENSFFHTRTLTQGSNAGHIDVTYWFMLEGDTSMQYEVQEKEASGSKWFKIQELLDDLNFSHLHRSLKKIQNICQTKKV